MRTSIWKRTLSLVLALAMMLSLVPAMGLAQKAEADETEGTEQTTGPAGNYITLPITIRDFAADGMLFEYNEVDSSDTITIGGAAAVGYPVYENPVAWAVNNYYSFRLYDYGKITFDATNSGLNWHCVICDGSGHVVDVLAVGEEKENIYDSVMQSGYFSIWVWQGDHENYAVLSKVTDANKSIYAIDFHYDSDSEAYKMYIGYRYNENTWGSTSGTTHTGINYFAAGQNPFANGYDALWADCLICDASGNVIQAIGSGQDKQTVFNALTSGFALFATGNDSVAQGIIRAIAGDNPTEYQATFVTDNYYGTDLLFLGNASQSMTIHQNDTKGFGLMLTGSNDRIQNLTMTSGPGTYVSNGTYGSEDAPDPIDIELNSGATQKGHGITIRKDLVEANLVDGKPVYTKDTVTYLAEYMNQIMNEPWQNEDGSYNSFFVMGTKLFDAYGVYVGPDDPTAELDLAAMLRLFVGDGGLGDYDTTMAKAASLTDISMCKTWFDAAYYLLHYTWQDSPSESNNGRSIDGYGMPVSQYESLHLLEKTNADGSVYYVFNSGYNNTAYNPTTKAIYNTQTKTVTAAQDSSGDFYTRGIKLPAARFDPLGPSGTRSTTTEQWLGYGPNAGGNTYGDLTGASATQLWADYYDETNYHLSLEGHAEFVFHYASNLYFTFTGDDDVYLYINGVRVLDLGAAHSIVKAQINLNDVATLCGLHEGEPASFDFFYLERHGTAANFGIETNIQLAQSGMITSKQGYQNGVSTGYNGPVDPAKPVAYSFTIKNGGDATLEHLTFTDAQLGVSLSEFKLDWGKKIEGTNADGSLVDGGPIKNMYLYIRDENDAIVRFYSAATDPALTDEVLMGELETGLPKGHSMTIYNFRYTISDTDWNNGEDTFTNVVNTTAIANGKLVTGSADWKVRKAELVTDPFHVYNWVNKTLEDADWQDRTVKLTMDDLVQPVLDAKPGHDVSNAKIVLCNGAGVTTSALWSTEYSEIIKNVTLNADGSIDYNSKKPGMETIYYKIEGIGYDNRVYHFDVITYGVADNVYVLDYGLKVELYNNEFGFGANDHLEVPQNIHKPTATLTGLSDDTRNYGTFTYTAQDSSVVYTPNNIINNTDSFKATIEIRESGDHEGKDLKFYGVDMTQTVTTAPASVVYYENDFPGITYVSKNGNDWVHYETVDKDGNPIADDFQSADQDSNYGSDPNYDEDNYGEWTGATVPNEITETEEEPALIVPEGEETTEVFQADGQTLNTLERTAGEAINRFLGIGGADSNGSVSYLEVNSTEEVMYFEFKGTGFEILSRTTDEEYAVILVQVQVKDENGNWALDKDNPVYKPVITESIGGDLYQVPIISITGLDYGEYRVVVTAAAGTDAVTRVLYIDGIRIYNPLGVPGSEDTLEYYRPEEAAAEFYEVKQLIQEGKTLYYDATEIDEEGLLAGDTYIEDVSGDALVVDTDDLSEYLKVGPNNELYLKGASYTNVIAFYATPMENVAEENRTLQIGAHRKIDSEADSLGIINMFYGSTAEDFGKNVYEISTGTEMYYTIDVDKLGQVDGSYLVIIGTDGSDSDFMDEILALTNLKICGYEIESIESKIKLAYEYGDLMDEAAVRETVGIYLALRPEEEVYEEVYAEEAEETELTESEDIEETEEAEEEVTGPEQVDSAMALIQSIL